MTDKDRTEKNFIGTLYALSIGVPLDRVEQAERQAAYEDMFPEAIGIRDAIKAYKNTDKKFNCKVATYYVDEDGEDFDEYYQDEDE